ncbi:MAG: response regulator [Clostridiales bacterium]|nr:response regulator [Clostridiales bacterium]
MMTVMIVDDYELFRQDIKSLPVWGEVSGFVVREEASNGREALHKLQSNPVDLLLTDIRMPVLDGLELIEKVTEQSLCSCIIIMSQFSDFEYARKGLSNGAIDYLLKPVNAEDLSAALSRAAAYIGEKRLIKSRMRYLASIMRESPASFFPDRESDDLVSAVTAGSKDAPRIASNLVEAVYSELGFDIEKTALVMGRTLVKVIDQVAEESPWIEKFCHLRKLKLDSFSGMTDVAAIKESFVQKIRTLLSLIRKYELDIERDGIVRMACRTILENIDEDITIRELSGKLFITRTYLSHIFRERTGMTLVSYLTNVKMERAKILVAAGSSNTEAAEILGFRNYDYFVRLFKNTTGISIGEYRKTVS